jgi:hypothetical protein
LFKLSDSFVEKYKSIKPPFGFNGLGELVYMRTYSRIKEDGTNEQWYETIRRVVEGAYRMQKAWIDEHQLGWNNWRAQKSAQEMYDRIFNMKFLPPGRGLWAMGTSITEQKKMFAPLNNCSFVSTSNLKEDFAKPFLFLMDMSMLGVGVGFDTKGAGQITIKGPNKTRKTEIIQIPDTREGWVESVRILLEAYFWSTADVDFDYSLIRKAGELIKGFGGISSGPEPLIELHKNIRAVLEKEINSPISITAIVDIMNNIGKAVVAGNVRRTAEIVFGDYKSEEYLDLKNYKINPHRISFGWTSNNSIFADLGMDYTNSANRTVLNGEPGYSWLDNMKNYSRMNNGPDFKDSRVAGGNPCVIGNTLIAVADGRNGVKIRDLVGTQYPVFTIENGVVTIKKSIKTWKTRENAEIWRLTLDDDSELLGTSDHKIMTRSGDYIKLKDLQIGQSLMPFNSYISTGFKTPYRQISSNTSRDRRQYRMIAEYNNLIVDAKTTAIHHKNFNSFDDCVNNLQAMSKEEHKKLHSERMKGKNNPFYKMSEETKIEWKKKISLKTAENNRNREQTDELRKHIGDATRRRCQNIEYLTFLKKRIKEGMSASDVREKISKSRKNKTIWVDFVCPVCKKTEKVTESKMKTFTDKTTCSYGCSNTMRMWIRNKVYNHKVKNIEFYGYEDVYDMTVEDTNNFAVITSHKDDNFITSSGIFVHNCNEQSLESYELCCLVETFPAKHDSLDDYLRTLKFAYLYAKTVTLGKTHWPETNRVMLRNRRIGCSMSGIQQFIKKYNLHTLKEWCEKGYNSIQEWDKIYSDWLVIPRSIKTTSIKPSGSVSLLAGATPGMHWPESRFYIRRMRLSLHSQLLKSLEKAGYHVEPCVGSENSTVVVEFPIDIGEGIRTVKEVSMWEQLSLAAFLQKYWSDNQVSCTVSFDPDKEGSQIKYALDYFQYQLKGISLLPVHNEPVYSQMPYEEINEERYNEMIKKIKKLNFNKIKGEEVIIEKFCDNEVCTI